MVSYDSKIVQPPPKIGLFLELGGCKQYPKGSHHPPRIDPMNRHPEPVTSLLPGHVINPVGDHAYSIDTAHWSQHPEQQGKVQRKVFVDLKRDRLFFPDPGKADAH